MEPFRMDESLRGEGGGKDFHVHRFRADRSVFPCFELQHDVEFGKRGFRRDAGGDPEGAPELLRYEKRFRKIRQKIRHQSRFADQRVIVQFPCKAADRNAFHGADLNIFQFGNRFDRENLILFIRIIGDLERENFAAQDCCRLKRDAVRRGRLLHDFYKRTIQSCGKHRENSLYLFSVYNLSFREYTA